MTGGRTPPILEIVVYSRYPAEAGPPLLCTQLFGFADRVAIDKE